jgi:hypothetical protein
MFDLKTVLPSMSGAGILIARNPPDFGCGIAQTLSRRGEYLAVEAIVVPKGCAPYSQPL